jgi:ATP-dependent Clp protease adaptor protein ClpS
MTTATDTIVKPKIATNPNIAEPNLYNVIYMNDDQTSMEFVIESLKVVFNYTEEDAADITLKIHDEGSAVVATLPYEMAEQKGIEVTLLARNNGYPLNVKLEVAQ